MLEDNSEIIERSQEHYSDVEKEQVNCGMLCPNANCKSKGASVEFLGWVNDGISSNSQYRCNKCEVEWEGY